MNTVSSVASTTVDALAGADLTTVVAAGAVVALVACAAACVGAARTHRRAQALAARCEDVQARLASVATAAAVAEARGAERIEGLEARLEERVTSLERAEAELVAIDQRREQAERRVAELTQQLADERERFTRQSRVLEEAQASLRDSFRALGAEALEANNQQFLELARNSFSALMAEARGDAARRGQAIEATVAPIRELLEQHQRAVREIETKRETAYAGLEAQIRAVADSQLRLDESTNRLVGALRRPEQRGRWGEMQLRNVVELAGMTAHCDFQEQAQTDDRETRDRPDMIVRLPGGGVIVVDSKVALDAYLDSLQPDADRPTCLARHARQVSEHWKRLAAKNYWSQFERSPRLVVLFMPLESALTAALELEPDLHARAMERHVLVATPTLLVALLRAVAYGWQQEDVAANARDIARAGQELYERVGTFVNHLAGVGSALERAGAAYNQALASLETRVLPSTRRLKELGTTATGDVAKPPPVLVEPRRAAAQSGDDAGSRPAPTDDED